MAVSDRSAAGCWLGFTAGWTSVFQILEQVSTIFILADSCCCCWLHYEILEGPSLCAGTGTRVRCAGRVGAVVAYSRDFGLGTG